MFANRALSLIILCAVGFPAAAPAQTRRRNHAVRPAPKKGPAWQKFHQRLCADARASKADLVFAGDSITEDWRFAGRAVWKKYYGKRKALNLGISGDQTQHLLWRLGHGNLEGLSPRLVVLLIRINNLYMPTRDIAAGIRANVKLLRRKLPRARILLLGVFPCGEKPGYRRRKIRQINKLASPIADGKMVHFLDFGGRFLGKNGTISKAVMHDHLHLTARGYEIWAAAMEPTVRRLMGK